MRHSAWRLAWNAVWLRWGVLGLLVLWGGQREPVAVLGSVRARALDGDTVVLAGGEHVRLPGVDTPERGRPFADQATRLTEAFLLDSAAGPLTLQPAEPGRDRYGRLLADLRRGERSLSRELLAAGLAWVYRDHTGSLLDTQAAAVEHRLGVHRGLDGWRGGPVAVTRNTFHTLHCPLVARSLADLPLEASPEQPLKRGLSPCRRCLPWPPLLWPDSPR